MLLWVVIIFVLVLVFWILEWIVRLWFEEFWFFGGWLGLIWVKVGYVIELNIFRGNIKNNFFNISDCDIFLLSIICY